MVEGLVPECRLERIAELARLADLADAERAGLRKSVEVGPGWSFIKCRPSARPADLWLMFALSEDYVRDLLGGDLAAYIGKPDAAVWGREIAAVFRENDNAAFALAAAANFKAGARLKVDEEYCSPFTGRSGIWRGVKFCYQAGGFDFLEGRTRL